jgi:SanA protein
MSDEPPLPPHPGVPAASGPVPSPTPTAPPDPPAPAPPPRSRLFRALQRTVRILSLTIAAGIALLLLVDFRVYCAAYGRTYDVASAPRRPCLLLLGTSPKVVGGRDNLHFKGRIATAAALYRAGKVDRLLVSGDNETRWYDEPSAMRKALLAEGVPEEAMTLDYAGFRTLDSVVRAKAVFGVADPIVVSDDFHVPRALYLADHFGLDAIAVPSDSSRFLRFKVRMREHAARILAFLDVHVLRTEPRFY